MAVAALPDLLSWPRPAPTPRPLPKGLGALVPVLPPAVAHGSRLITLLPPTSPIVARRTPESDAGMAIEASADLPASQPPEPTKHNLGQF